MTYLTESHVESAALAWKESLGWGIQHRDEIAPDNLAGEDMAILQTSRKGLPSPSWNRLPCSARRGHLRKR